MIATEMQDLFKRQVPEHSKQLRQLWESEKMLEATAERVYTRLKMHVSKALPAWKVSLGSQDMYVTQDGTILGTLASSGLLGS